MQSFELTQPVSSAILLKQFESRFGQTMNLQGLDKTQLEDLANSVRTKIHTITDNLHFGKELKDNEYQKNLQNALLKIGVDDSRWDKIPGLRLLQWQKLNYLISEIGKEKLLTYENVYKLRTDLNISHKEILDYLCFLYCRKTYLEQ